MRLHGCKLLLLAATLALAGCARGPDEAGLQSDVQAQLDTLFGSRILEVRSLRRQGSAPLVRAKDGGSQAIVYYNAVLAFTAPYDPSDWNGLSPELVANALGATDQGVIGLGAGRMAAGAKLRAYGSMVYRRTGDAWQASLLSPVAAKPVANVGGPAKSTQLIERLAGIVNTTPGLHGADEAIITEELDQALQNIKLRLNRGEQGVIVATGPAGGEYARFVESLRPRGAPWSVSHANTHGSVANALMIDSGEARYALVQSDVAAAAVTGQAAFASYGPLRHLRAVAALFPEPVHVVIRSDDADSIGSVSGLRGKRIAVGSRGSGTRQTAMQVLRAHDLGHGDYVIVDARSPEEALQLLADGQIDAVVEVVSAPWRQLAAAAAEVPMTLLPLEADAMARVSESVPGLVPLAIPDRTYGLQQGAVDTLAATALLVASDSVPDASVEQVLDFLFTSGFGADRGASASRLSRERALAGVTIPLHDGAADYFAAARAPAVESPAAATQ
jgi:TRAP transporter TAXI family solute receptor